MQIAQLAEEAIRPSERPREFIRSSIHLAPDWRWSRAIEENELENSGLRGAGTDDLYVSLAIRMQKLMSKRSSRTWVREKWGAAYDVYTIGVNRDESPLRSAIEAQLMEGAAEQDILSRLRWLTKEQLLLYRKWFFDLSGVQAVHEWMDHYVFRPKIAKGLHHEAVSLMFAYHGDMDSARDQMLTGRCGDINVLREVTKNERLKKICGYIMTDAPVPMELYASLMESAIRQNVEHQHKSESAVGNDSIVLSEEDIKRLNEATAGYADDKAREMMRGSDGVEVLNGIEEIRKRWLETSKTIEVPNGQPDNS